MKTKLLLLTILVLTILSTYCTKHITHTVTEYVKDTVTVTIRDTVVTVEPEIKEIITTDTIEIPATVNCPEPPVVYTDTTWVKGTYSDAYALVWANKVIVGIKEGKHFDLQLKGVIRERDHYKEMYRLEKQKTVVQKSTWKKDALIVLLSIAIILLLAIKLLNR